MRYSHFTRTYVGPAFSRSADNNVRRQCDDAVHCAGPYVVSAACVMPPPMTD